jgi:hypothetical protein
MVADNLYNRPTLEYTKANSLQRPKDKSLSWCLTNNQEYNQKDIDVWYNWLYNWLKKFEKIIIDDKYTLI